MAGLSLTEASGMLKEFYLPAIREQLHQKNMLLNQIRKGSEDVEGSEAVLSLHVRRNSGVGNIADGGSLRTPGNQKHTKQRVPLRTVTGRGRVSIQTIKAAASDRSSFVRAVHSEMEGLKDDARKDCNRQLWGTSDGVIAACGVTGASTTVVLAATTTAVQMRQLQIGMKIDIGTVAAPTGVASDREITAVNASASPPTITISGAAVTTATTDRVFRSGNGGSGANQVELTGLQTIADSTGTLFSVDPTTYPSWAAYEDVPGADRTPTENVFEKAIDEVEIAGGEEIDFFATSHGVRRAYSNQLSTQKRFADTVNLKGGFKGLSISAGSKEAALVVDVDCPSKTAIGVTASRLKAHEWSDWEFMDDDGSILSRTADKLEYEFTLYWIAELATDRRNSLAKLGALTEA